MARRSGPQTGIVISADISPGLDAVRQALAAYGTVLESKYLASAVRRAAEQAGVLQTLKSLTPRGKTGNLKRSATIKSKRYPRSGVGIAIVGYKSGRRMNEPYDATKLGYHQGLVEFGTAERFRRTAGGFRVSTGRMPRGGKAGRPPVRTTWEQTRSAVESNMIAALSQAAENAAKEVANTVTNKLERFL